MTVSKRRSLKISSVIQRELVYIFCKLGIKYITISEVKVSDDIKHATVFFVPMLKTGKEVESNLQGILSLIKTRLSKSLHLRCLPELRFKIDESFDRVSKIDNLLLNG